VKRDPALVSLSHDHHQALFVAHKLTRAGADTAAAARAALLEYWDRHGRTHFRSEEELLLPAYAAHHDPYDPLVVRVLCDHIAIRQLIAALERESEPSVPALHELGHLLASHVRLEERQLFPSIEAALPAAELAAVAAALERGGGAPADSRG
jgi:hemerythrin-like domain-containing protein